MKFESISETILNLIEENRIKAGERLPSIRDVCLQFQCNKATAIRAYQELEKNHLIYAVPKSGYYVMKKSAASSGPKHGAIDFSAAAPDSGVLPYQDFQHCINQAIAVYRENLFTYLDPRGLYSLRQTLSGQLRDYQIFADPEQICITSGSQQALDILSKMPFPNGKTHILIEQPTYFGVMKAAQFNQVTVLGIYRRETGIDLEELERIFRGGTVKFFYTIPRFHNPLGVSYGTEQKRDILRLAAKYDVYVVEDDYLADLETNPRMDPLYSLDRTDRVIYIRSYSKTLMPGLRLGVAVLPPKLGNIFADGKRWADLSTSILSQGALEIYLKSGMYQGHLRRIRQIYQERMACLKTACRECLPEKVRVSVPETGFFASIDLPFRFSRIEEALRRKNVIIRDIASTYLPGYERPNLIRIGICKVNEVQIRQGIQLLADEINQVLHKHTIRKVEDPSEAFPL